MKEETNKPKEIDIEFSIEINDDGKEDLEDMEEKKGRFPWGCIAFFSFIAMCFDFYIYTQVTGNISLNEILIDVFWWCFLVFAVSFGAWFLRVLDDDEKNHINLHNPFNPYHYLGM